jgi:uncharacterized membrane protein YhaH (DUF805 family)
MASLALALAVFQDTSDQQQQVSNMMGGIGAGIVLVAVLFGLAIFAFFVFLFWRILTKAGMAGPLALLLLIPGLGQIILLCILAFGDWKVMPVLVAAPYYPPAPPPPPPPSFPQQ